tara:strand:+ start:238 stop:441 length:204 start_codon:yes stop_codon:yes gene_type:complete
MLTNTTELYITDKNGKTMFKTLCSTDYYTSEERNLKIKLVEAKNNPEAYYFIDLPTAEIVINHSSEV